MGVMLCSTMNTVNPCSPASLDLRRNAQGARQLRRAPCCAVKGDLLHLAEPLGLACWNCGIPVLIGNLATPKHGIKTAEVDN